MTSTNGPQLWQERVFNDILNSDGNYNEEYTLPRGSGATFLFTKIAKEFTHLFGGEKAVIVLLVRNQYLKKYVESYISGQSIQAQLTGVKDEPVVHVFSADDPLALVRGVAPAYVDWLLNDGVGKGEVYDYLNSVHFNNQLTINTR